ncbi:hybrid sensor histidine kinase/response regulator [Desulfococcus multivorans]|uniref:histidine kinase n=1 Tax=Desulfococcus multivorans DSM 2059 TaxID=1121405 RepID=S7UMJ3_DESML|nr:PAS domain-containing sensor histidine kinase [Desulfococcus multivorans]EPR35174.1 histidine kinase [Desulfococcus multivorans DSM 2059]SJZ50129.1 Signal transduction histidine kinase [Desulfococcus multivorans DSM 2059]
MTEQQDSTHTNILLIRNGLDIPDRETVRTGSRERLLSATLDALTAHVAVLDETGMILTVNKAWRDFAAAADAKPEAVSEGVDYLGVCDSATGDDAPLARAFGAAVRDVIHGRSDYFEVQYPCHDDREKRWFVGRVTPLPGYSPPRKVVTSHLNITDRVVMEKERDRLEEQLRNAQKLEAVGTLAGGIAHDFNNILSAVIGYTDLLLEEADAYPAIRDDLEEIARAGMRARDLVAQLLSFSRQARTETGPVQIYLLVKEALKMLRSALPSNIEIVQEIQSFAEITADPGQIHQLLMNLCTNAYQAMREDGGVLTVRLEDVEVDASHTLAFPDPAPGPYQRLTVSDTGVGMDEATRRRIFDPYFTTREKGEGSGLGLSVVHGIVRTYGGGITVDSRPGKGSTFTILLPAIKARETAVDPVAETVPFPVNERILFVDDEPQMLRMARQMLQKTGYRIDTLDSSLKALEQFKADPDGYDIVISDMTMPGLTGDRLAVEILKIRPDLPMILCTGFSERIDEDRAAAIGVRKLVMKPFVRAELVRAVQDALAGSKGTDGPVSGASTRSAGEP